MAAAPPAKRKRVALVPAAPPAPLSTLTPTAGSRRKRLLLTNKLKCRVAKTWLKRVRTKIWTETSRARMRMPPEMRVVSKLTMSEGWKRKKLNPNPKKNL